MIKKKITSFVYTKTMADKQHKCPTENVIEQYN